MFSKRSVCFFILCLSLSLAILIGSGCIKKGNDQKTHEEGEITESDEPLEMDSNVKEIEIEEEEAEIEEPESQNISEVKNPVALIETSMGNIKIELFEERAPISVKNFIDYANEKFYDGTIFHRVIPNFVIQGGGFTEDMTKKPTHPPINNEAGNQISNTRGTVAMARTPYIHSATSQFYINLRDNKALDHRDDTSEGYGYCVFGRVIEGMDVVDSISRVPRDRRGAHSDVPVKPVIIKSVRIL
ncbi:MAG: peptidylprolyl isomerase [bacterium]